MPIWEPIWSPIKWTNQKTHQIYKILPNISNFCYVQDIPRYTRYTKRSKRRWDAVYLVHVVCLGHICIYLNIFLVYVWYICICIVWAINYDPVLLRCVRPVKHDNSNHIFQPFMNGFFSNKRHLSSYIIILLQYS